MLTETFHQEILYHLRGQQRQYPAMAQQDIVKFVFQAMLGVGHLLSSREIVEDYIAREMDQLPANAAGPLYEVLSPSWCRLSLYGAREENFPPSVIAGLMVSSFDSPLFTRQDVFDFCTGLAASGEKYITDPDALHAILDETWIPSHSPAYREHYHPAYRVISAGWIPCLETIRAVSCSQEKRVLITVDGPCASGKTTLAEKLAGVFGAAVVHTDDYVIPHAQKTAERLAVPGGNCDAERLFREVVMPWKNRLPVSLQRYDCRADRLLPPEALPDCSVLILEGSYCNLPLIRDSADFRLFLSVPPELREERLRARESPESLKMFHTRWIPLENEYFSAYRLPDPGCIVIRPDLIEDR